MSVSIAILFIRADETHKYRWDYKLLIDAEGVKVFYYTAKESSITKLEAIARPTNVELHNRTEPEKQKVYVIATIVKTGLEKDRDYHIVLKSGSETLISEIPDPTLDKLKGFPELIKAYANARSFIDTKVGVPPHSIKDVPTDKQINVKVTGVVFFDKKGHGDGHSENGIEIHPVLEFKP